MAVTKPMTRACNCKGIGEAPRVSEAQPDSPIEQHVIDIARLSVLAGEIEEEIRVKINGIIGIVESEKEPEEPLANSSIGQCVQAANSIRNSLNLIREHVRRL